MGVARPADRGIRQTRAEDDAVGGKADPGLGAPVCGQRRVRAQFEVRGQAHAGEAAGAQAVVQGDGHGLVGIGPEADREVIRLALLAFEDQGVGLFASFQVVGDGLEGVGAVDAVQEAFDDGPVIHAVGGIVLGVEDPALLPFLDAEELDLAHLDLRLGQVEGGRMAGNLGHPLPNDGLRDGLEQLLVLDRVLVALVDDVVDGSIVEGKHGIALQLVMDADVQHLAGGTVRGGSQEGDGLQEEVDGGVELVQFAVDGHVRADDDIRAHRLGDIDGIVVPHAAVQEHFAVLAHGAEVERDGHRGPEGIGNAAGGPVLGRHGVQVRGDAGVGDGQVREADAVLVADGHGAEHVPHVQAVQEAVGHAQAHAGDGLVEHVGRTVAGFRRHLVGDALVFEAVRQVLVIVVVGEAQDVGFPVFPEFIADVFAGDVV